MTQTDNKREAQFNEGDTRPRSTDEDKTPARSPHDGAGRYPCRIPIRMTVAERAAIGRSACAADQSVSRYLVELATLGRPARPEDKARLRYLRALFRDAAEKTQGLLSSPLLAHSDGDIVQARSHLTEAARLLQSLSLEVGRRLDGDARSFPDGKEIL